MNDGLLNWHRNYASVLRLTEIFELEFKITQRLWEEAELKRRQYAHPNT